MEESQSLQSSSSPCHSPLLPNVLILVLLQCLLPIPIPRLAIGDTRTALEQLPILADYNQKKSAQDSEGRVSILSSNAKLRSLDSIQRTVESCGTVVNKSDTWKELSAGLQG